LQETSAASAAAAGNRKQKWERAKKFQTRAVGEPLGVCCCCGLLLQQTIRGLKENPSKKLQMSNYGFDLNYTTDTLSALGQPLSEEHLDAWEKQLEEEERMIESIQEKIMEEYDTMIYRPWLALNPEPEEYAWMSPELIEWFRMKGADPPLTEQDVSGLVGAGVGELKDFLTKVSSSFFTFTHTNGLCFRKIDLTPDPALHGRFIEIEQADMDTYGILYYLDCETGRVARVRSDNPDPYNTLLSERNVEAECLQEYMLERVYDVKVTEWKKTMPPVPSVPMSTKEKASNYLAMRVMTGMSSL
jgi:hypothetical protein